MSSLLRALVASGVIEGESAARIIEGLLAASEIGACEHSLCVLDFAARRSPETGGMDMDRLQMALELRAGGDHARFVRTIRAILIEGERARAGDATPNGNGAQRLFSLPSGAQAAAYSEPGWEPWRTVSWASLPGVFAAGLGENALETWFSAKNAKNNADSPISPAWAAHRRAVDAARPHGDVFFEAFVDIDALRRGFDTAFASGRGRRALEAMRLSNARNFMMHARWIDPPAPAPGESAGPRTIALDATWSARSNPPDHVGRLALSEDAWPAGALAMQPPPGSYVIAVRADWRNWFEFGVELESALTKDVGLPRRREAETMWRTRHGRMLEQLLARAKPWLVLSDAPAPIIPIPGATTIFIELNGEKTRPGDEMAATEREFSRLLDEFPEIVAHDAAQRMWWVRLDGAGALRIPAWGFVNAPVAPLLVAGWGPPVVDQNRKRLEE